MQTPSEALQVTVVPYSVAAFNNLPELEFSQKDKDRVIRDIAQKINTTILELKNRYGDSYKGVIAAIIFGSCAKKNFRLKSDLDIIYITETSAKGVHLPEDVSGAPDTKMTARKADIASATIVPHTASVVCLLKPCAR
jgi:hypothetical protein